jgi:WD40 repeat protein
VFSVSWHPTAPHLISRGEDTTLRVWDIVSGRQVDIRGNPLALPVHHVPELWAACGVSSDGNRLFAGKTVLDYRATNETPIQKDNTIDLGEKDLDPVRSAMFSPDERWIATGHKNGVLRLWDGKTFAEKAMVKGSVNGSELDEVRFSHSGKLIVTAGEGIVPAFDAIQKKVKSDDTVVRVWRVNLDPK